MSKKKHRKRIADMIDSEMSGRWWSARPVRRWLRRRRVRRLAAELADIARRVDEDMAGLDPTAAPMSYAEAWEPFADFHSRFLGNVDQYREEVLAALGEL